MTFLTALAVGILFGSGAYAMAHRDAFKLAGGTLLIGNAAVLFLMAPALRGSAAPLLPTPNPDLVADPLVQALALTAVVINFAVTVLLLRVAISVERTHDAIDMDELGRAEAEDAAREDVASFNEAAEDEPKGRGPA